MNIGIVRPNLADIVRCAPALRDKLGGSLGETPNEFYDGKIISWPLLGSCQRNPALKRDSTVGIILPGQYSFKAIHEEWEFVLDGVLHASIDNISWGEFCYPAHIIVSPGEIEHVRVKDRPAVYLCEYW